MTSGVYLRTKIHRKKISRAVKQSGKRASYFICAECGHKLIKNNDIWEHKRPHPEHVCRCDNPNPWTFEKLMKIRENMSGLSTYTGFIVKEHEYE